MHLHFTVYFMMLQLVCTVCISVGCVDVSAQILESNRCTYELQSSELQGIHLYSRGEKWRKKIYQIQCYDYATEL